jgi:hypothetical protein
MIFYIKILFQNNFLKHMLVLVQLAEQLSIHSKFEGLNLAVVSIG